MRLFHIFVVGLALCCSGCFSSKDEKAAIQDISPSLQKFQDKTILLRTQALKFKRAVYDLSEKSTALQGSVDAFARPLGLILADDLKMRIGQQGLNGVGDLDSAFHGLYEIVREIIEESHHRDPDDILLFREAKSYEVAYEAYLEARASVEGAAPYSR